MKKAFSLVEMLVAVILVTLLVGTAIFSFKHQMLIIKKTPDNKIKRAMEFHQLRTSIESMKYYVVQDYDAFDNPLDKVAFYFDGDKSSIKFITKSPLFSDSISVVNLKCESNKLIYKEEPLYKRINYLKPKILKDSKTKIFLESLKGCQFKYFFNGEEKEEISNTIPNGIEIRIETEKETFDMYSSIKNDDNNSYWRVYEKIYESKHN